MDMSQLQVMVRSVDQAQRKQGGGCIA